eukprot:403349911
MEKRLQFYLSQTGIDSLLLQAFNSLRLEKPQDPIIYLSNYLQERSYMFKDAGSLVTRTYLNAEEEQLFEEQEYLEANNSRDESINQEIKINQIDPVSPSKNRAAAWKNIDVIHEVNEDENHEDFQEQLDNQFSLEVHQKVDFHRKDLLITITTKRAQLPKEFKRPFSKAELNTQTNKRVDDTLINKMHQHFEITLKNKKNQFQINDQQAQEDFEDDESWDVTEKPMPLSMGKQESVAYVTTKSKDVPASLTRLSYITQRTLDDYKLLYKLTDDGAHIYLPLINRAFEIDYHEKETALIDRCRENQQLIPISYDQKKVNKRVLNIQDLFKYLRKRSLKYQNVINISEIARGGEAIVYRLEYLGMDEVVIKTTQLEEKLDNLLLTQQAYIDIMGETQHLRLLQNPNFLAEIKEEIIEYDLQKSLISRYCVIVERASYTLYDLLMIWKNPVLREKYVEEYSPQKLAYYFYRSMQILAYLHQRNFYYGDMKPQNLLVFRDQQVKVGDLGTSFKLDDLRGDNEPIYGLKGISKAYASQFMNESFQCMRGVSKKQLFDGDKFSLIRTFQQCLEETKGLKYPNQTTEYDNVCDEMLNDLIKMDILEVVYKFSRYFAQNTGFVLNLIDQMKNENKWESLLVVSQLSKYKFVIDWALKPAITFVPFAEMEQTSIQKHKLELIDNLHYYDEETDYVQNQNLETKQSIEEVELKLQWDLDWKKILIDILKSIKDLRDTEGVQIIRKDNLIEICQKYYYIKDTENETCEFKATKLIVMEGKDPTFFIKSNEQHFFLYFEFQELTFQDAEILRELVRNMIMDLDVSNDKNYERLVFRCMLISLLQEYETQYNPFCNYENELESFIPEAQSLQLLDIENKATQYLLELYNLQDMIQNSLRNIRQMKIFELYKTRDFFKNNMIDLVLTVFETLKIDEQYEDCLQLAMPWLQRYIDLHGDSNRNTLRLYGLVGELLVLLYKNKPDKKPDFDRGLFYMNKFAKLSLEDYLKTLQILQQNSLNEQLQSMLEPYFSLRYFDKKWLTVIIKHVYSDKYEKEELLEMLDYLEGTLQKKEELQKLIGRFLKGVTLTEDTLDFTFKAPLKYEYPSKQHVQHVESKVNVIQVALKDYLELMRGQQEIQSAIKLQEEYDQKWQEKLLEDERKKLEGDVPQIQSEEQKEEQVIENQTPGNHVHALIDQAVESNEQKKVDQINGAMIEVQENQQPVDQDQLNIQDEKILTDDVDIPQPILEEVQQIQVQ